MAIQFHKIWVEQCEAAADIRQSFCLENALDYLIGQKLFTFLLVSEQEPTFEAEVPAFVEGIRKLFTHDEIRDYLDHLERKKFLAPPDDEIYDLEDETDEDVFCFPDNPVTGAEELLRFSRVRQLLQTESV